MSIFTSAIIKLGIFWKVEIRFWNRLKIWNLHEKIVLKMYKPVPIKCYFMTFNNDQNWAVCSPSLNAIFYQTPHQRIFILWKFIVLNVYFKGVLTVSSVLFFTLFGPSQHMCGVIVQGCMNASASPPLTSVTASVISMDL